MAEKKLKDKKIDLYASVTGKDEEGFPTTEFKAIASGLWAYVRSLSRKEIYADGGNQTDDSILFVINYREDVKQIDSATPFYVKYKDIFYKIVRVDPFEFYKDDLYLYCQYTGKTVS